MSDQIGTSDKHMKFIVTGGQTGGHIYPAIAVASALRQRGCSVVFAGCGGHMEEGIAREEGLDFLDLPASGFDRSNPLTLIKGVATILGSVGKARRYSKEHDIDAVIAFGGYACLPAGLAAKRAGAKLIVHEQNSYPGIANKALAKRADAVCLTYEQAADCMGLAIGSKNPVVSVTGNPVRHDVMALEPFEGRHLLDWDPDDVVILAFGGSQGSQTINDSIVNGLVEILEANEKAKIVLVSGKDKFDDVRSAFDSLNLKEGHVDRVDIMPYIDDLPLHMANADLIVSRAGATTLSELAQIGTPSILVPFPFATEDHQTKNANVFAEAGSSIVISDEEAKRGDLAKTIAEIIADSVKLSEMRENMKSMRTEEDAALEIASIVIDVCG